jgi:glucose/arabinose dehydrogenase
MAMPVRTSLLLLLLGACGKHPLQGYGLEQRQAVQGLQFPTGLPQPGVVQPVVAFPNLTFDAPLLFAALPDGSNRVVVVQQGGLVRIFTNDPAVSTTSIYLDLSGRVLFGGEEGLLGLAFHPDYAQNGQFYVYYSMDNPRRSVISRFQVQACCTCRPATAAAATIRSTTPRT